MGGEEGKATEHTNYASLGHTKGSKSLGHKRRSKKMPLRNPSGGGRDHDGPKGGVQPTKHERATKNSRRPTSLTRPPALVQTEKPHETRLVVGGVEKCQITSKGFNLRKDKTS